MAFGGTGRSPGDVELGFANLAGPGLRKQTFSV